MSKNYSYIGISFIILVFGIWAIPKIVDNFSKPDLAVIGTVPEFSFTNQNRNTISNEDYKGKVYVAEFFFTTCPSICPIMNRNMVRIQNEFYGNPDLGIASFSIDPEYDTPEILKSYAESYEITNPSWHLLTGEKAKIFELANAGFNLYVGENSEVEGGFEHSGYFALIDQEGNIRSRIDENGNPIIYYDGLEAEGIQMLMEDIELLLKN
ncbi:MAG: SCO family protein [Bacteroidia bacterium]|nr:SCO family protein [Bacteroidia bacterium]NNF30561.1 SCO family protein [Flavobacteriaceae bacterium]MBT8277105.1 SCO family protein [Bacteroidia bacterium]NNJ83129.1 SCO family protein [Flavobacteriaceae bacterium]NNK53118.1 SCO family protein [Flavobacteriaceae bacterium]